MTYYFKSCCDSSFTFTLTDYASPLILGQVWYVVVPNYFSGCCTVVSFSSLYPDSPTYSSIGATLQGHYDNCGVCTASYVCNRVTGTNQCDIVTITPMTITCSPNLLNNSITMLVSGGTPPYKILWSTGTLGPTLANAKPNELYSVTVTDYNWPNGGPDYTATTTCSLIVVNSPTPTPTPTPTPIPVVYPNLCLEYYDTKDTTLYTFVSTGNIVNGKPTWSSGSLTLQWGDQSSPYWFIIIGRIKLVNINTNIPPIGGWTLYGGSGSATSYEGDCLTPRMTLKSTTVSPPTCVNTATGSLIINPFNAQQPVLYSIDGGVTTQTGPIFNSLAAGTYSIWVQDSNSVTQTQSVTIPNGLGLTNYSLAMVTSEQTISSTQKKLTFRVFVTNSTTNQTVTTLPAGTVLTFNIEQQNDFRVTNNASFGEQLHTVVLTKNGVNMGITPTITPLIQTTTINTGCVAGTQEFLTANTLTYGSITISGSDVISGTVSTTLVKKSNQACYVKSQDTIKINSVSAKGCSCCNGGSRFVSSPMNINIVGTGVASSSFQIIKGSSVTCQSPQGFHFPSPSNLQVFVPIGMTPATANNLFLDSALTQYVTPSSYFFAYNSRIYKVTNNNSVYTGDDLYGQC